MSPSAASFGRSSVGKCCVSSHSMTCGRISASANSRMLRRSSSCSGVNRRSMCQPPATKHQPIVSFGMPYIRARVGRLRARALPLVLLGAILLPSTPAFADATVFVGSSNQLAKGVAIGVGLLVIGFEFEFSDTGQSLEDRAPHCAPAWETSCFRLPFQSPDFSCHFTTGTGIYRERLEPHQETNIGFNTGGGAKISASGPSARAWITAFSICAVSRCAQRCTASTPGSMSRFDYHDFIHGLHISDRDS